MPPGNAALVLPYSWKKGQSGNPKGRPPKAAILTPLLEIEIEKVCEGDKLGRTYKELIVLATMRLAIKGHPVALKEIYNRLDGAALERIELTGAAGGPIETSSVGDNARSISFEEFRTAFATLVRLGLAANSMGVTPGNGNGQSVHSVEAVSEASNIPDDSNS